MIHDRIKTILLYADSTPSGKGLGSRLTRFDAAKRYLKDSERRVRHFRKRLQGIHIEPQVSHYERLSYVNDWKDAFCKSARLDVTTCDINHHYEYWRAQKSIQSYPLIVILHSATGDDMTMLQKTESFFQGRRGKMVVFIGNEYDLMEEKIDFLVQTGAEYVGSQLPSKTASWLYQDAPHTEVLATPHGLNHEKYPTPRTDKRVRDIGFRGAAYKHFIGDHERENLIDHVKNHSERYGLDTDIVYDTYMTRDEWSTFLGECSGIVGAESGSYFLDRRCKMITAAKEFVLEHPTAAFDDVFDRFFKNPSAEFVSGKCISSRHFEPIGTKTCQMLVEGHFNGILEADEHYVAVKKDLSNIDDAVAKFRDISFRKKIVDNTYEYVLDQHTYHHRVDRLVDEVSASHIGKDERHQPEESKRISA